MRFNFFTRTGKFKIKAIKSSSSSHKSSNLRGMNRRRRAGGGGGGGSTDMQDRSINAGVPREGAGSTHPPTPTSTNQSSSESSSSINSDPSGCNNRYPGFPLAVLAIFSIATRMAWLSRPDDVVYVLTTICQPTIAGHCLMSFFCDEPTHPPHTHLHFL